MSRSARTERNGAGNGSIGYTPAAGFTGIDSFTYRAGSTGSSTADAQASINLVPVNVGETTTLDLLWLSAEEQIAAGRPRRRCRPAVSWARSWSTS